MSLSFHPDAERRFDELAVQLCARISITAQPPPAEAEAPGEPPIPVAGHITDADLIGEPTWEEHDQDLIPTARYTGRQGHIYGLVGEGHAAFRKLTERLQCAPALRDVASLKSVGDFLFNWAVDRLATGVETRFCAELLGAIEATVVNQTLVLPVYEVRLASPLQLGAGTFKAVTASDLNDWLRQDLAKLPQASSGISAAFERMRMQIQGRTAYWVDVRAEPAFAADVAIAKADQAIAVLRLFSRGMFQPIGRSYVTRLGMEALQRQEIHRLRGPEYHGCSQALVSPPPYDWFLDAIYLETMVIPLIRPFHELLVLSSATTFQDELKSAVFLYSRAALYDNISEKLLHILASLESILLRNDTEPIVSSLSERVAFLVGRSPDDRLAIAKNVREVYGLRSRFVHHGTAVIADTGTLNSLRAFMLTCFKCVTLLVTNHTAYTTREALIDTLERRKFT